LTTTRSETAASVSLRIQTGLYMEQLKSPGQLPASIFPINPAGGTATLASRSYRARAYGLDLWSDIPLPEFMTATNGLDVVIRLQREDSAVACTSAIWDFRDSEANCTFPNVGRFRVRAGREIQVTPAPGSDPTLLRLYVEGMMMAVLLHQRGHYVLHASVVEIGGHGVAFLGHIGAGKSTMALALQRRGHRLIADDNAAIDLASGNFQIIPAFPRVKVYPAIAQTLGIADENLSPLHVTQVKKTREVEGQFSEKPVRLDRIYLLSRDASPVVERLNKADALVELITNSIPTRWGLAGGPNQMKKSAAVARQVPVYRARTFHRLEEIEPLTREIEVHAMAEDRSKATTYGVSLSGE